MKVLICDDHTIFCSSVAETLKAKEMYVDTCFTYDSCVELVKSNVYDVFICDLNIGNKDGFELVRELSVFFEKTRIIFLSAYYEPFLIDKAQKIGANAFLTKDCSMETLIDVMFSKNQHFDIEKINEKYSYFNQVDKNVTHKFKLSKQEKEIIKLILEGKTSKEIADVLFISKHTVDTHRTNIYKKLEVSNAVSLVQFAKLYLNQ